MGREERGLDRGGERREGGVLRERREGGTGEENVERVVQGREERGWYRGGERKEGGTYRERREGRTIERERGEKDKDRNGEKRMRWER